ncbi:MAG: 3-keto-5-aminohexanoate cleavage protein [Thermoleophilaceae bacterium]
MSELSDSATWSFGDTYETVERLRRGMPPAIITCALNGGVQGKEAHPAIPETPEEIAAAAAEAYEAGASIVHIHGRHPDRPWDATDSPDVYREINARVRERCPEIIVNNTTGGGMSTTMEDRLRCLEAAPELASLNMGPEMTRFRIKPRPAPLPGAHDGLDYDGCTPYTYGYLETLAGRMRDLGVRPEMETYHAGQFWVTHALIERGLIEPPYVHQFVMGYQTSVYPTVENLCGLVRELPAGSLFFVCGIGPFQFPMTTAALLLGGHVRVGLEDNIYRSRGQLLDGNGEAVARIARIVRDVGREVASPAQAREMLGLGAPRAFDTSSDTPAIESDR